MGLPTQDKESCVRDSNKYKVERFKPVNLPKHVKTLSDIFNNASYQGKHVAIKETNKGIDIIAFGTSLIRVLKEAHRQGESVPSTLFVEKQNTFYHIAYK